MMFNKLKDMNKKFIFGCLSVLAMSFAMTSCSDDDNGGNNGADPLADVGGFGGHGASLA